MYVYMGFLLEIFDCLVKQLQTCTAFVFYIWIHPSKQVPKFKQIIKIIRYLTTPFSDEYMDGTHNWFLEKISEPQCVHSKINKYYGVLQRI